MGSLAQIFFSVFSIRADAGGCPYYSRSGCFPEVPTRRNRQEVVPWLSEPPTKLVSHLLYEAVDLFERPGQAQPWSRI